MKPIHVKEFNKLQYAYYQKYCNQCKDNGITPEPQDRYFPQIKVNYGYVVINHLGHYTWKKRKSDFSY